MRKLFAISMLALAVAGCSSINCPLNNSVAAVWRFTPTLSGSLTVSTFLRNDETSTLINQQSAADSLSIPLSYTADTDTFDLTLETDDGQTLVDQIRISKTNVQHFESIECSPAVFHQITGVESDGEFVDSVAIINPNVTFSTVGAHIIVYTSLGSD